MQVRAGKAPGIYVHVPFCSHVCPYCDFAVLVGDAERRRGFVEALIDEIRLVDGGRSVRAPRPRVALRDAPPPRTGPSAVPAGSIDAPSNEGRGRSEAPGALPPPGVAGESAAFDTVYFGGGTPSLLEPAELSRIAGTLREELAVVPDPWIFLEANPEDVTAERLAAWRELGVRTLSLGVQSFDSEELDLLGRRHTAEQSRRAVELASEAGFATLSIDLIYGLPGQSLESWRRNLETAVALAPDHLSCYELTVHRRTVFGVRRSRGELVEMPEERQADLFLFTHRYLGDYGYPGYEVSNFATAPEHRSQHNTKYWDHTPYLGLGPSAHSFDGGRRWWNERRLGAWERRLAAGERPVAGGEDLGPAELALERLMLGLRTYDGVDLTELRDGYGVDLRGANAATIAGLVEAGLLDDHGQCLLPTANGLAVADSLARAFRLCPAA